jgi:hypothetical protein
MTLQILVDSWLISSAGGEGAGSRFAGSDYFAEPGESGIIGLDSEVFQPYGHIMVPFPVAGYQWDEFFFYVSQLIPLVFVIAYLYPVAKILEGLVREKETRMDEMLKMMGVSDKMIVGSWYITYGAFFFILAFVITIFSRGMLPTSSADAGGFSIFVFSVFFLFGMAFSTVIYKAVNTGLMTKATNKEDPKTIIKVMGKYFINSPIIPGHNIRGTNAAKVVAVDAIIGHATSLTPRLAASKDSMPSSIYR